MARVPYLDRESLPEGRRALLDRPIAVMRALANSPGALEQVHGFAAWIRGTCDLDARCRELAILQVAWVSKNAYEWAHHVVIGRDVGISESDIEAIRGEADLTAADGLDPLDRLVLDAARQMTLGNAIPTEIWEGLEARFSARELVDLVVIVSFYVQVVRLIDALGVELEPEYGDVLDLHPLDRAL